MILSRVNSTVLTFFHKDLLSVIICFKLFWYFLAIVIHAFTLFFGLASRFEESSLVSLVWGSHGHTAKLVLTPIPCNTYSTISLAVYQYGSILVFLRRVYTLSAKLDFSTEDHHSCQTGSSTAFFLPSQLVIG